MGTWLQVKFKVQGCNKIFGVNRPLLLKDNRMHQAAKN
jgi:hypothetical protein